MCLAHLPKSHIAYQMMSDPSFKAFNHMVEYLSGSPHPFLHDDWMDFLRIWYHKQVSVAADACKITFSSVPYLGNHGIFLINCDCCETKSRFWPYLIQ